MKFCALEGNIMASYVMLPVKRAEAVKKPAAAMGRR